MCTQNVYLYTQTQIDPQDETAQTDTFFVIKITEIDLAEFEEREIVDTYCTAEGSRIPWYELILQRTIALY